MERTDIIISSNVFSIVSLLREQIPCPFMPWTISISTFTKNKKEACICEIKQNCKFSKNQQFFKKSKALKYKLRTSEALC